MTTKTKVAMIGCGGVARYHLSRMVMQTETTQVCALCEPSAKAYAMASEIFVCGCGLGGLRMVKLYEAIKAPAAQNGVPVILSAK